jgi:hypothetical protein
LRLLDQAGVRRLRRRRRYLNHQASGGHRAGSRIGIYPANEFRVQCYVVSHIRWSANNRLKWLFSLDLPPAAGARAYLLL